MPRRLVTALLAALPLLAGFARSADAVIVDSFSDIPGAVFHNIWHPSPCSAHFHDPVAVDVGGGHLVTVTYYSEVTQGIYQVGCANWTQSLVSYHVPNDPAVDPGDLIGDYQSVGTAYGDLIFNFSEPLTGFGGTSIIAYSNSSYDPDRFIAYDGPNGTGNVLGQVVSDNVVPIQVRRDFKGLHLPSPQIRSVRYVVEGLGFMLDGIALAVAGDPLDVPVTPGGTSRLAFGAATPNPFSGATRIALSLPASGHVRVEVFGPDGRRVRTLADRDADAGALSLAWDGRDERGTAVPPGVYLARATHAGASATRRVVLAR